VLKKLAFISGLAGAALLYLPAPLAADEIEDQLRDLLEQELKSWISEPMIIAALKRQNQEHAGLDDGAIDAMDQDWRTQAKSGGGPLIDRLLDNDASGYLAERKEATDGLVTEVFVMDNRGLNVAQSDITSDYMQGDEAKWQKTYPMGPTAVFIDEVEFDDSTETFQCQVSATVADPATGEALGAVTFGINIDELS
jgi:hypothetical protein